MKIYIVPESIERFIGDQAFLPSYDLAPPPLPSASGLSFSVFLCVAYRAYWRERWGKGVIRRRDSLVLFKSFNNLCIAHTTEKLLGEPLINYFSDIVPKNGEASANSFRFHVGIFVTFLLPFCSTLLFCHIIYRWLLLSNVLIRKLNWKKYVKIIKYLQSSFDQVF